MLVEETGEPLPGATIRLQLVSSSLPPDKGVFVARTRSGGRFQIRRLPAGVYRLQASSEAHRLGPAGLSIEEGKTREVTLELAPVAPYFSLGLTQHAVTPDEMPQVTARGFLQGQSLEFRFYRVDPAALFARHHGQLHDLLRVEMPPEHSLLEGNPALTPAGGLSAQITRRDVEGIFHQRFDLTPLRGAPGVYLIAATGDDLQQIEWVMITRLGLILKCWQNQALAYVADLATGEPVADAAVELSLPGNRPVSGHTGADGTFTAQLPGPRTGESPLVLARAEKDGSQAFVRAYVYSRNGEGQERVYTYTDRPVYRPGHVVRFKGIARRFADSKYSVLSGRPVTVEVWDPLESPVYKGELTTSSFGSFAGELHLNDEASTGLYRVSATVDGEAHESYFKVAEYRKPEYKVEVRTGRKRYTRGERIAAEVSAEYYFGAPVAGAEVRYLVRRSPYWFYATEPEAEYEGEEEDEYDYGEVVAEGTARADEQGVARFSVATEASWTLGRQRGEAEDKEAEGRDYRYTIEAWVGEPGRQWVSASGSTLVTQGEFALFVRARTYVTSPGQPAEVEVVARDYDGRPIRGVRVDLTAGPEIWEGRESRVEEQTRGTITTDSLGEAVYEFTPKEQGSYRVRARAGDRKGHRISAATYLWVTGWEYSDLRIPYPELEIIADKEVYQTGETAVFLINSELKGARALVTVEGPRLYEHHLVTLKGSTTRFELPIRPEFAPNFFLCVSLVRDKEFASQERRVKVSVEERLLRIAAKANKESFRPGEQISYELSAADWKGRPVSAELSVGVVDESVYAIQEEMVEPISRFFYPPRPNSVETSYSFAQIYLDADKSPASIKVRRRFPDTAYWNPTVVTGPDGRARVSFAMPDTLTTWRATVRGVTLDTAVGQTLATVKCTKDLLVRLETPRFMTQHDRLTLSAVAHNYTKRDQPVGLWLTAPGLRFPREPKAGEKQRFRLGPDEMRRQDWQVEAPAPGSTEVTAYLQAEGGPSDAMALVVPVLPHGRERLEWRSGAVADPASERLLIRKDAVPGTGDLRIRLSPSLAGLILGALEYLTQYPYGCTEQTMSSFLPDVVVARALRELGLPNSRLEERLPGMVQSGLNRLYRYQHEDGGWGWWEYDQSDPWMTSYVVFGLLAAKASGSAVNQAFLERGIDWLERHIGQQGGRTRDPVYPVYVLSLAGRRLSVQKDLNALYRDLNSLDGFSLALLTSALIVHGRNGQARVAASRLWRLAEQTGALISWKGRAGWGKGGSVETTAMAFQALYALDPGDPRLLRVVRWLVLNREGNHWVSTRDTAFVLLALTDFLKGSRELQPDYRATVMVNGKVVLGRRFTASDLFAPEVEVRLAAEDLRMGENLVTFTKEGSGNLYYTLILRQFVGREDLAKVITGAGISVDREYHRLQRETDRRTGIITTRPSPRPTADLRSGEPVLVRLTIRAPHEYEYVIVEDPIPAGCEVAERGDLEPWEWDRWWSHMDVRDEKVAVFARRLPAGKSTIEYHLRPLIPGDYHVMPTEVYSMYNPDLRGSGAEHRVKVR